MRQTARLRHEISGAAGVIAPLVLNALMARLAAETGFGAGYLGGGAMGFLNCGTEANLSLTQIAQAGLEIAAQSSLPLIMDGTCGWGDPMHVVHTVRTAEAAGFAAIEIEDQILPKRAHHHIGVEHVVPGSLMEAKIAEAVAARRDRDFLIIARTNAARVIGLDEGLRRAEAMHRRGADLLMVLPGKEGDVRAIAERLPAPLAFMMPTGGIGTIGMTLADLRALGYALIVDPATPFFAMYRALRRSYDALARGESDPTVGADGPIEERHVHSTLGLAALLEIERRTVERGPD